MTIKGFSTSLHTIKAPDDYPQAKIEQRYVTLSSVGSNRHAIDTATKAFYPVNLVPATIDAVQPSVDADRIIFLTGHGARVGDILKFRSGALRGIESEIIAVPDANTMVLALRLPSAPIGGVDTVQITRGVNLQASEDGSLAISSGPIQFVLDGSPQQVVEDTATPANNIFLPTVASFVRDGVDQKVVRDTSVYANNRPLPVELISTSGTPATFNLTAGDIAVHVTHDGNQLSTFDSVRIGNGTNLLAVLADGSITTRLSDGTDNLDINADGSIKVGDGTEILLINAEGSVSSRITDGTDELAINADGSIVSRISDGTNSLNINADGSVRIGDGTETLLVNADGSINAVVTATNLDVRDLTHVSDSVKVGDGTDFLAVNGDGSINAVVTATNLDVRDLTHVSDSIKIGDGTDLMAVNADGSINSVVTATDLDVRDLTHVSDSIKIGDGTDLMAVNADGSINSVVTATDLDIRGLSQATDSVAVGDGTTAISVDPVTGELFTTIKQNGNEALVSGNALAVGLYNGSQFASIDTSGRLAVAEVGGTTGIAGSTSSATLMTFVASGTEMEIFLQADSANTDNIRIGFTGANQATTTTGYELLPGASISMKAAQTITALAVSGTQKINYIYVRR